MGVMSKVDFFHRKRLITTMFLWLYFSSEDLTMLDIACENINVLWRVPFEGNVATSNFE